MIKTILLIITIGIPIGAILRFFYEKWWMYNELKKFREKLETFFPRDTTAQDDLDKVMNDLKEVLDDTRKGKK